MKTQTNLSLDSISNGFNSLFFLFMVCCYLGIGNQALAQSDSTSQLTEEQRQSYISQAQKLRSTENYKGALVFIDSILTVNPFDVQILLFKGDVLMQDNNFRGAVSTLRQLLPLQYDNAVARINLSYALFKCHKPEKALFQAKEAWLKDTTNQNATVNYFNAMLWNVQTKEAKLFLNQYAQYLDEEQPIVLMARWNMTLGDFNAGLKLYDSLARITKNKYYIQEYAEVQLGKQQIKQSMATMVAKRNLFSENEWLTYMDKYKAATAHRAGTELNYFKDVAKNIRQEASLFWEQGGDDKIKFGLRVGTAKFSVDGEQISNLSFAQINSKQRWNANWSGETELTLQNIKGNENVNFQTIIGKQSIKYQPHDRRMLTLFYNSEVLNYTSSLLQNNIRAHNLGAKTNLLLTARSGFYGQGSRAFIADGNRRTQLFGSLYHLFRTEPILKVGWNNSYLHFNDNKITNYFSPNRYLSTEIFTEFQYNKPEWKNFFFNTQGALGLQQIEKGSWETGYRLQAEAGFNRKHTNVSLMYRKSNVAFNSGTGYQFDWFTLRFVYKWN